MRTHADGHRCGSAVAQGFVRCGQCTNVFNALLGLSDERQPTAVVPVQEAVPEPAPPAEVSPGADDVPPRDDAQEESHARGRRTWCLPMRTRPSRMTPRSEQTSLEFNPDAADVSEIFVEPDTIADDAVTGTYESIVLVRRSPHRLRPKTYKKRRAMRTRSSTSSSSRWPRALNAARQNQLAQTHTGLQPLIEPFAVPKRQERAPARAYLWIAGLVGLGVFLMAQIINHYRDDLAVNPRWHRPLTAIYAAFGIALVPRWDLAAYEVHQLGASAPAQSSGELTVRASIKNDAATAAAVAALARDAARSLRPQARSRDVAPRAYLVGAPAADALLPAGERVDAQMAFVDPGRDAVGFEIDACLPSLTAQVHCANEAGAP